MDIENVSNEKLKKMVQEALSHLVKAAEALPFLLSLSTDERMHTTGKLRDDEPQAISAVLTTVKKNPAAFAPLKLDADHLADMLSRRSLLQPIAEQAQQLATDLNDTLLHLGAIVKTGSSAAYHVASALAPHDTGIAHTFQPAQDFYGAIGRHAARTRKHDQSTPPAKA